MRTTLLTLTLLFAAGCEDRKLPDTTPNRRVTDVPAPVEPARPVEPPGMIDAGSAPMMDAGAAPMMDAGTGMMDAGAGMMDAGSRGGL